jgi:hypothetical protein
VTSERILQVDLWATVVLAVTAAVATAAPDPWSIPYAVVGVAAFAGGCVAFVWSYAVAVGRSRTEELSVVGIYFLTDGAAPPPVRRRLLLLLVAQCVIVVVAASIRPFTAVAFGVLAPMLGLGLTGLWGARFGEFPAKDGDRGRRPAG